ncbi:hypothetical protein H1V43_28960 [Streptomyces sp. PSKA54]|uniref:Uncharacterized protein n=1 Tax=Streptomyces himalayensis subsp. aureolus TaxID=2758039 RepID=A0A7W2HIQ9_9ACTN|nr:hypothetical protein [Streptomyces himalayensis]MBA4865303.1 hypothetical protein [Streptomyces himalayensis subsp. aureolus]
MSEYQYYEFLAVDRPLDPAQLQQVRSLSTRATISPTRFVNEYHWGDFRGDTTKLVEQLYDAHLYYANWGSRRLVLRLPVATLPAKTAAPYVLEETLSVWTRSGHTLLDFSLDCEDGGEWDFETSFELSSLIGLRAELAAGDLRPLYLAWLAALNVWELAEDDEEEYVRETEPPVPAGLSELTGPQRALADFLKVDPDLLTAAAQASEPGPAPGPDRRVLVAFIASLPAKEKDDLLLQAVLGTRPQPGPQLLARYLSTTPSTTAPPTSRRSAAELLDAAYHCRTERIRREQETHRKAVAERARAAAQAHQRHLDQIARDLDQAWHDVERLIAQKKPTAYDSATTLLRDLREIHTRRGTLAEYDRRAGDLRAAHRGKPALMRRLDTIGVPNP